MTFASWRQIVILTLLTAALLFTIDRVKNPRRAAVPGEPAGASVGTDTPTIRLWLNDLSCGGCRAGVEKALSEVSWLGAPKVLEKLPALDDTQQTADTVKAHPQQVIVE